MKLKYLDFTFAEIGKKIAIDEARITSYYDENSSEFTEPEKRRARHILIQTTAEDSAEVLKEKRQRAEEVLKLARANEDFVTLAKQYSEGPGKANGGDLGFFAKGQMIPAFEEAVFAMKPGEISEVVTTSFGYHIIKLEEIQASSTKGLPEVHDEILAKLQNTEAQSLAFQMANSAYEGIISGGSLQSYADSNSAQQIIETDFFPRSKPPAGLEKDQEFLAQAFTLKSGELSSIIQTPAGYYIVFAEGVQAPETPALDKVRKEAAADFTAEMAARKAEKTAADVLARIRAGEAFGTVISENGLAMNDSGFLGRSGSESSAFPQSLVAQIFLLSKADPYPDTPGKVDEDYYVFSFQERQIPEVGPKEELEKYRQTLLREKQQELLLAYISNLEKDAKITVHSSL
jgi:peptidyl-prolyl cis-trans isomerase D